MPKLKPLLCDWVGETEDDDCNDPATHELIDSETDEDGRVESVCELGRYCAKHAVMALEDELRTTLRALEEVSK